MRAWIMIFLVVCSELLMAKYAVKVYHQRKGATYYFYADSEEKTTMSLELDFDLNNLKMRLKDKKIQVLKPNQKKKLVAKLQVINLSKPFGFNYKWTTNRGDHHQTEYDIEYNYHLPFEITDSFKVIQGYHGDFTHQNQYAIDFYMPEGTPVKAIRAGYVVDVVDQNSIGCVEDGCEEFNNYVMLYHSDGTFAIYGHLQNSSSEVKKGDKVEKGQVIALSGNTGFSNVPHLHIMVFLQRFDRIETVKTKFLTKSEELVYLEQDKMY